MSPKIVCKNTALSSVACHTHAQPYFVHKKSDVARIPMHAEGEKIPPPYHKECACPLSATSEKVIHARFAHVLKNTSRTARHAYSTPPRDDVTYERLAYPCTACLCACFAPAHTLPIPNKNVGNAAKTSTNAQSRNESETV